MLCKAICLLQAWKKGIFDSPGLPPRGFLIFPSYGTQPKTLITSNKAPRQSTKINIQSTICRYSFIFRGRFFFFLLSSFFSFFFCSFVFYQLHAAWFVFQPPQRILKQNHRQSVRSREPIPRANKN